MSHTAGVPWGPRFMTSWRLNHLPGGPKRYGAALARAARVQRSFDDVSVQADLLQGVVIVSAEFYVDELPAALDRSLTVVFQLIREAGLDQPGSLWLMASETAR